MKNAKGKTIILLQKYLLSSVLNGYQKSWKKLIILVKLGDYEFPVYLKIQLF